MPKKLAGEHDDPNTGILTNPPVNPAEIPDNFQGENNTSVAGETNQSPKNTGDVETINQEETSVVSDDNSIAEGDFEALKAASEPVTLRVKREHIENPHSILLRWKDGVLVEARKQDHSHTKTIGAKTINDIFVENGAHRPQTDQETMEIVFSKTGEIVVIQPVDVKAEAVEEKETEA